MVAFIYDWVRNILVYLIIVTIVQNLLPQGQYSKYIKVFTGLILIIIVILPLVTLTGLDKQLQYNLLGQRFNLDQKELQTQYENLTEEQDIMIVDAYVNQLKSQMKHLLEQENIYVSDIQIEVVTNRESDRFGSIENIYLTAAIEEVSQSETIKVERILISSQETTTVKSAEEIVYEKKIKNVLINFYKVSSDNIYITIQKAS